jgi:hypothetical protein
MTLRSSDFKSDVSTDFTTGADFYKLLHIRYMSCGGYFKALINKAFLSIQGLF